jgi:hypothetical protein
MDPNNMGTSSETSKESEQCSYFFWREKKTRRSCPVTSGNSEMIVECGGRDLVEVLALCNRGCGTLPMTWKETASGMGVVKTKSFEGSSQLVRHSGTSIQGRVNATTRIKKRESFVTVSPPTRA